MGSTYFHNGALSMGMVTVSLNSFYKLEIPASNCVCSPYISSLFPVFNPRYLRLYLIHSSCYAFPIADGFDSSCHLDRSAEAVEGVKVCCDLGFCVFADVVLLRLLGGTPFCDMHTTLLDGAWTRVASASTCQYYSALVFVLFVGLMRSLLLIYSA